MAGPCEGFVDEAAYLRALPRSPEGKVGHDFRAPARSGVETLGRLPGVGGCTILGSGRVALILGVADLLRMLPPQEVTAPVAPASGSSA